MTIADTTGITNEKQGCVLGNNFLNEFFIWLFKLSFLNFNDFKYLLK